MQRIRSLSAGLDRIGIVQDPEAASMDLNLGQYQYKQAAKATFA